MRGAAAVLASIALSAGMLAAQGPASKALQVYVVDTEGGKATLYVAPGGQTVLVDSGNPGGRDTHRIMAALSDAGATTIDYLVPPAQAAAQAAAPAAIAPAPQGRGRGGAAAHTPAYWIKISAQPDGTFTVANSRNGFSKTDAARAK